MSDPKFSWGATFLTDGAEILDDGSDDDIPWADPAIRTDYEAALGRLILAHNELDYRLSNVFCKVVEKLVLPPEIAGAMNGDFSTRLGRLELIAALRPELHLSGIAFEEVRNLNGERNILAHGYFDQNPFDGSYEIQAKRKRARYPVERLDNITERLSHHANQLHYVEAFHDFDDLPEIDDPNLPG